MTLKQWIPFIWFQIGVDILGFPKIVTHYELKKTYIDKLYSPKSKFHK